ncbi:hypothetical protein VTN96DRAFT_9982 [Rasamsonia emersonii]
MMKPLILLALWTISLLQLVSGQISYDPLSNNLICKPGQNYCSGHSLQTNILMSCAAVDVLKIYSCDVQLSHVLPSGYKTSALCYQSSPSAGDACRQLIRMTFRRRHLL